MTVTLSRAMLLDNFEHGSIRLWFESDQGNGTCSVSLETGKYVKAGDYGLHFDVDIGATLGGSHYAVRKLGYYEVPMDLSAYTHLYMWLYATSWTAPPVVKCSVRNNGTWGADVNFTGEQQDLWKVVSADISGLTRTDVDRIRISVDESDYATTEPLDLYIDDLCLVSSSQSFNFQNTDEDLTEEELVNASETLIESGLRPVFDFKGHARRLTIKGNIPTTTDTAIIREAELEDLLMGTNQYYLQTDLISMPVKVSSYTSTIRSGEIDTFEYTVALVEDFGDLIIPR